jgi:hypothetical protein
MATLFLFLLVQFIPDGFLDVAAPVIQVKVTPIPKQYVPLIM